MVRDCLKPHIGSWNSGIMINEMETTIVYWGYIRIMETKMEATILFSI